MADTRHVGNDYSLYVNPTSEPALPDEITNYTLVGLEIGHEISTSAAEIAASDKTSGAWSNTFTGEQNYTLTVTGHLAKDGNAGVDILETANLATTSSGKLVYWLSTTNATGDDQRRGSARVTEFAITENNGEMATFTCTLSGVGAYTKEDVDA